MTIDKFYNFGSKLKSSTLQVHADNLSNDNKKSEKFNLLLGNYANINFPLIFNYYSGQKLKDILDTGTISLYLISDNLKEILEKHKLTGWKTYPVKIYDKNSKEIKGYHGFSITGRCGPIDYAKSEISKKQSVPNGPISKYYKGLNVGLSEWDNSDLFIPKGCFNTIMTEKTTDILRENKISNIKFENLAEMEMWEPIVESYNKNLSKNLKVF